MISLLVLFQTNVPDFEDTSRQSRPEGDVPLLSRNCSLRRQAVQIRLSQVTKCATSSCTTLYVQLHDAQLSMYNVMMYYSSIHVTSFSIISYYSNGEIDLKNVFETNTPVLTFVVRGGKRIPSPLTISYYLWASLISRLALHWQHKLGISMVLSATLSFNVQCTRRLVDVNSSTSCIFHHRHIQLCWKFC